MKPGHFAIGASVAVFVGGCGGSPADAEKVLADDGFTAIEVTRDGNGFAFKAKKGKDACTGTVTIKKSLSSISHTQNSSCELDTSACKPGAAAACNALADELYGKEEKVFPTKAAELYRVACADSNAHACARVGEFEGIEKHWDKVSEYSTKACELGSGDGCARVGFLEAEGQGRPKDEEKALTWAKKGCDLGGMRGCRAAAGWLFDKTPSDPAGAIPYARKACDAKLDDSCFVLGAALLTSKTDFPAAFPLLEAACKDAAFKNRGFACNLVGVMAHEGQGIPKDLARSLAEFDTSCEASFGEGCANAGKVAKAGGPGLPRDTVKADAYFAKACALGKKEHCAK